MSQTTKAGLVVDVAVNRKSSGACTKIGGFGVGCSDTLDEKTGEIGFSGFLVPGRGTNRWYRDTVAQVLADYLQVSKEAEARIATLQPDLQKTALAIGADFLLSYLKADEMQKAKQVTHPRKEKKDKKDDGTTATPNATQTTLASILGK